jgi:DNA topoisomerase-3
MGRPFAALLRITDEYKLEFDFGQKDDSDTEPVDFSGQTSLGGCPKCGHNVYDYGMNYVCEKSVGPEKTCDFRSGKMILQQEIAPEQIQKLLATGKTDLLEGFVSSRTNRKFKAYLAKQENGKIGFEFEPRPEKPGAKTAGKTAVKKAAKTATKTALKTATKTAATKTAAKTATKSAAKKATASKTAGKTASKTPAKTAAKKAASKTAVKKAAKTSAVAVDVDDDDPPF